MRLTIRTTDQVYIIADLENANALDLAEEFRSNEEPTMTFEMDDATVIIDRRHIVALELD